MRILLTKKRRKKKNEKTTEQTIFDFGCRGPSELEVLSNPLPVAAAVIRDR
jgi:hypothetical protein